MTEVLIRTHADTTEQTADGSEWPMDEAERAARLACVVVDMGVFSVIMTEASAPSPAQNDDDAHKSAENAAEPSFLIPETLVVASDNIYSRSSLRPGVIHYTDWPFNNPQLAYKYGPSKTD